MKIYTGIVENRNDPLKVGRCKVRVHGVHENDTAILPTEDLPWSVPVLPTSSASISGVGTNPGVVVGSIVAILFTDPDLQMPLMLGSIPGVPQDPVENHGMAMKRNSKSLDFLNSISEGEDGELVESKSQDGSSSEDITLEEARPVTAHKVTAEGLNNIKESFPFAEQPFTDTDGKMTIGYGQQTWEGKPVTLTYPGSVTAANASNELERHINDPKAGLKSLLGKNIRKPVTSSMYDALASFGHNLSPKEFSASSVLSQLNSGKFGSAASLLQNFSKKAGDLTGGLDARRLTEAGSFLKKGIPTPGGIDIKSATASAIGDKLPNGSVFDGGAANLKEYRAFGLASKKYSYPKYTNESDISRLVRGEELDKTSVYVKEASRFLGVQKATSVLSSSQEETDSQRSTWETSDVPYNAEYPYNKALTSEAGHSLELDDTPEAERLSLYSSPGSFIEYDHNGTLVDHVVGDRYIQSSRNSYSYTSGNDVAYIAGDTNLYVRNGSTVNIEGECNVIVNNNVNLTIAGNMKTVVKGNYDLDIIGDEFKRVAGNSDIQIGGDETFDVVGRGIRVQRGNYSEHFGANFSSCVDGTTGYYLTGTADTYYGANFTEQVVGERTSWSIGNTHIDGAQVRFNDPKKKASEQLPKTLANSPAAPESPIELLSPIAPSMPELEVNSRSGRYRNNYESIDEGEGTAYRDLLVSRGIYREENLDLGTVSTTETPTLNPTRAIYELSGTEVIDSMQEFPTELQLSARFQLSAFTKGGARTLRGGGVFGISKTQIVKNLKALAEAIAEPVYDLYPNMQILAGYRNQDDIENSSKTNLHYTGQAMDIRLDGFTRQETFDAAKKLVEELPYGFDTLTLNYNGKKSCWLHISYRLTGNREVFSTVRDHLAMGNDLQYIPETGAVADTSGSSRLGVAPSLTEELAKRR